MYVLYLSLQTCYLTYLYKIVTARRHPPPGPGTPPCAVHAGRYGQQAGGMHPTGMQSCLVIILKPSSHLLSVSLKQGLRSISGKKNVSSVLFSDCSKANLNRTLSTGTPKQVSNQVSKAFSFFSAMLGMIRYKDISQKNYLPCKQV